MNFVNWLPKLFRSNEQLYLSKRIFDCHICGLFHELQDIFMVRDLNAREDETPIEVKALLLDPG